MQLRALASGLALLFTCTVVSADDVDLPTQFSACIDQSGGVTSAMLRCVGAETTRQDARLNLAYKAVMAQLSPARKKQLQGTQWLWIKYRDANCHFYADVVCVLNNGPRPGPQGAAGIMGYTGTEPLTVTRCIKRRCGRS
jgi:uncharacterized protein YecT (DUF1311 family)